MNYKLPLPSASFLESANPLTFSTESFPFTKPKTTTDFATPSEKWDRQLQQLEKKNKTYNKFLLKLYWKRGKSQNQSYKIFHKPTIQIHLRSIILLSTFGNSSEDTNTGQIHVNAPTLSSSSGYSNRSVYSTSSWKPWSSK